ncbi:MAG: TA system VapC family ribonuclease toxin [Acidimicrobiales bacterium]
MILVDANLLIYAHAEDLPQHDQARSWLDSHLSGRAAVGLPWASLLAFLRIISNPRALQYPEPIAQAWVQVQEWLDAPPAWIPQPTERHRDTLATLINSATHANLVPDAHLAALAIEHGLVLASSDGDFAQFQAMGLRWENPLA